MSLCSIQENKVNSSVLDKSFPVVLHSSRYLVSVVSYTR